MKPIAKRSRIIPLFGGFHLDMELSIVTFMDFQEFPKLYGCRHGTSLATDESVLYETENTAAMEIPFDQLSPEALRGLVAEFVSRDGTDYGDTEASLESKIDDVLKQLKLKKAVITYDEETQSCNIVPTGKA